MTKRTAIRPDLKALLDAARNAPAMTASELREQRISFAYGNASFENESVTRAMVEHEHDRIYCAHKMEQS